MFLGFYFEMGFYQIKQAGLELALLELRQIKRPAALALITLPIYLVKESFLLAGRGGTHLCYQQVDL